jgi:hypothetical protein
MVASGRGRPYQGPGPQTPVPGGVRTEGRAVRGGLTPPGPAGGSPHGRPAGLRLCCPNSVKAVKWPRSHPAHRGGGDDARPGGRGGQHGFPHASQDPVDVMRGQRRMYGKRQDLAGRLPRLGGVVTHHLGVVAVTRVLVHEPRVIGSGSRFRGGLRSSSRQIRSPGQPVKVDRQHGAGARQQGSSCPGLRVKSPAMSQTGPSPRPRGSRFGPPDSMPDRRTSRTAASSAAPITPG